MGKSWENHGKSLQKMEIVMEKANETGRSLKTINTLRCYQTGPKSEMGCMEM